MHSLFRPVELVNTQTLSIDQINQISISYIAESVTVFESDSDMLVLKEYYNEADPDLFAEITAQDGAIVIKNGLRPMMFNLLRGHVEVFVPRAYYGVLNVKSVSGKIEIPQKIVLSELTISNTSGKIVLAEATAGTVVLSTVSGAIEADSLQAMANIHSTSGAIRIGKVDGDGRYKTVSGAIDVAYHAVTGDIDITSVSGRIRLIVPPLLSFVLDASSVSGSVHIPFAGSLSGGRHAQSGTVGDATQVRIKLRTVSGRIEMASLS